jgi:hypothetical protein
MRYQLLGGLFLLSLSACRAPLEESPQFIIAGDIDGDGRADAVTINRGFLGVSFLRSDGQGGLERAADFNGSDFGLGFFADRGLLGDVDGDGDLDLLAESGFLDGDAQVLLNDGVGGFLPGDVVPGAGVGLALADLDADGDLDVAGFFANVFVEEGADPRSGIRVLRNDGAGIFGAPEELLLADAPAALAAGDLDADGDIDLVLTTEGLNSLDRFAGLQVLRNDGAGRFSPDALLPRDEHRPDSLVAADFDGDGIADIAIGDSALGQVDVLLNDGAGGLASAGLHLGVEGGGVAALTAQDFNGDGRLDLAFLSGRKNSSLSLLTGGGAGEFFQEDLRVGPTRSFSLLDLDGDGRAELLRVPRARDVVEVGALGL